MKSFRNVEKHSGVLANDNLDSGNADVDWPFLSASAATSLRKYDIRVRTAQNIRGLNVDPTSKAPTSKPTAPLTRNIGLATKQ